jgi:hypothetical protein
MLDTQSTPIATLAGEIARLHSLANEAEIAQMAQRQAVKDKDDVVTQLYDQAWEHYTRMSELEPTTLDDVLTLLLAANEDAIGLEGAADLLTREGVTGPANPDDGKAAERVARALEAAMRALRKMGATSPIDPLAGRA